MPRIKIAMVGAGSGFVISVARELAVSKVLQDSEFVLMDTSKERLGIAERKVRTILKNNGSRINISATTSLKKALDGAGYVITSCEIRRWEFWIKDIEIPERHGVYQLQGENGGPGGQIHALRNIGLFMDIAAAMRKLCPKAWLLNFTNPMSYLCTYLNRYTDIRTAGFCHQVHGTFGVIAEMLGMKPGDLEVISGGVNHFNWVFDIRKRGDSKSYLKEFMKKVKDSRYWQKPHKHTPRQEFTLEVLKTFGVYPVGYDGHIVEYLPFFYEKDEWKEHGYEPATKWLKKIRGKNKKGFSLEAMTLQGQHVSRPPFPRDETHPYYAEKPCQVIKALETNTPTYLDAVNIINHGSISNLPADAVVDVPAVVVGGKLRGVHVGELPIGPMELCRRQITLHEMIARASYEGDPGLAVQALCLDPYIHSITQARRIWKDYCREYRDYLPQFKNLKS